jgi:protocatechuate 3,4-dioxygenase beta subunit
MWVGRLILPKIHLWTRAGGGIFRPTPPRIDRRSIMATTLTLSLLTTSMVLLRACAHPDATEASQQLGGGQCDDCVWMLEGMPAEPGWETTLSDASEPGERMTMSGTIYKKDGRTPAPGVILYVYHTDNTGRYTPDKGQTDGRRHGHLRGWVRSDEQGRYRFHSIRPAAYPSGRDPQHVHVLVKEPGLGIYWIDNYEFEDDPLLTAERRAGLTQRGGSGIIVLNRTAEGWKGQRDIVLGLNVPGYP